MDLFSLLTAATDFDAKSDDELREISANLKAAAKAAREAGGLDAAGVQQLQDAAAAVVAIKAELSARAEADAALAADADAAIAALDDGDPENGNGDAAEETPAEGDGEAASEGDGAETPAEGTQEAAEETPAAEDAPAEAVAAAGPPARTTPRRPARVPQKHQPKQQENAGLHPVLLATGEMNGVPTGHEFTTLNDMYRSLHSTWYSLRGSTDGRDHRALMLDYRHFFPAERQMGSDPWENAGKVQAYVDGLRGGDSLVASGGVPGPNQPKYDLITYGITDRPVRDALPAFSAQRGAVTWNVSPTIEDFVVDTSNAAINNASSATDASGGSYKTVQEITAVTAASATVEAEYLRLQHGNWADRFLPELMQAWMKNALVRKARHDDLRRFNEIVTGSTHYVNTPAAYGAYRDLKRQVIAISEELEDRLRDPSVPLRILMPEYVPAMLATDLIAQEAGDGTYSITEEMVRADMQSWDPSINFSFVLDGNQTNNRLLTTPTQPGGTASPRSASFDADVDWIIFPEGTWAFLDGGTLDLGIVRDSTLNAQNRFQTFLETWEVAAKFGPFSYRVTSSLCANGDAQIATASHKCGPAGS